MTITTSKKLELIKEFGKNEKDSGSTGVQVAILTTRINNLQDHFAKNKKDNHSRRGLLAMVSGRRKLLDYLKNKNNDEYLALIKKLGLRK